MTNREQAAFRAGVQAAIDAALVAAVTMEVRDGHPDLRHRTAVAALQGLAAGLKEAFITKPATTSEPPMI